MDSLVQRLRAAAAHDGLGIGEAWNLLDEAADALTIQATTSANLHAIIAQRDEEIRHLREVRQHGCDCSDDEACLFARQRDEARAEVALIKMQWQEAAAWREQIHAAERERDEARQALAEAQKQRDEARDLLAEARDRLKNRGYAETQDFMVRVRAILREREDARDGHQT